jgi:hypothetical protein
MQEVAPTTATFPKMRWFIWSIGTFVIVPASCILALLLAGVLFADDNSESPALLFNLSTAFFAGAFSASGHYLFVRRMVEVPLYWILVSGFAALVGGIVGFFAMTAIRNWCMVGVGIGTLVGLSQWSFLRTQLRSALWWVVLMITVWTASLWLFNWYVCNEYIHRCWP